MVQTWQSFVGLNVLCYVVLFDVLDVGRAASLLSTLTPSWFLYSAALLLARSFYFAYTLHFSAVPFKKYNYLLYIVTLLP